jgi:hypothetical protein
MFVHDQVPPASPAEIQALEPQEVSSTLLALSLYLVCKKKSAKPYSRMQYAELREAYEGE